MRRPARRDADAGFTLAELIIVISILGVLGAVLGAVATQGIKLTTSTGRSLNNSVARTLVAAKLLDDIRGAATMGTSATGAPRCGDPSAGTTRVLWTASPDADGLPVIAAYDVVAGTADGTDSLVRVTCAPAPGTALAMATPLLADPADTQIDLAPGSTLPPPPFNLIVGDEVVRVTLVTAAVKLTVARTLPAAHAAGDPVRLQTSNQGLPIAQWPVARLAQAAGSGDLTIEIVGAPALPAGLGEIVVDTETMTVTGSQAHAGGTTTLNVTRTAGAAHAFRAVVSPVTRLAADLVAADAVSPDPPDPAFHTVQVSTAAGLPHAGPYRLRVGTELMTVTAGFGTATLTVVRTNPALQAAGAEVRYEQGFGLLCDGRNSCGAGVLLHAVTSGATQLRVAEGEDRLPPTGDPYDLAVGDESMLVYGGLGTGTLDVSRPTPTGHGVGDLAATTVATPGIGPGDIVLNIPSGAGLPTSGPYTLAVGAGADLETVTVTGKFGTTALDVTGFAKARAVGEPVEFRPTVVGTFAPRNVQVFVPTGLAPDAGPALTMLSVTRRAS